MVALAPTLDPPRLAQFVFGHDLWQTPVDILRAVFKPRARVAVKSCHASGKTHTSADAVLLALLMGGDVITTAPTWTQVEEVLWGAIHRSLFDARIPIPEWGTINRTEIRLPTGEFAIGLSTNEGVRFQGYHAREGSFLLVVFDEAPGIRADIYTAVEGIRSGGDVRLLYIGNPVVTGGPFYDIFAGDHAGWYLRTISAFDTPNFRGVTLQDLLAMSDAELQDNERPYLITRQFVHEKYHEWGEDHPEWQARILGQFPDQGSDSLISLSWIEDANARAHNPKNTAAISVGIDVAGPGEDETVVAVRRGNDLLALRAWTQSDPRPEVIAFLRPYLHQGLSYIVVDSVSMGHYFWEDMRQEFEPFGVTVLGANVGLPSRVKNERGDAVYANLKAEWYWSLRERLMNGDVRANGVIDQTTQSQLVGLKYEQPRGVVTIEKKEDARKRGFKSPDRAEALMLAYAPDDPHLLRRQQLGKTQRVPTPQTHVARGGRVVQSTVREPAARRHGMLAGR